MMSGLVRGILVAILLGLSTAHADREALTVEDQYELGQRYLKRGYYTKAIEQFNRIRNYYRDDPYSVKAELAIADVFFKKHEWDQARLAYEDFMRMHPRNPELDYVVYRIGLTLYKKAPKVAGRDQTWTRQAVNTWSGFEGRFPESEHQEDVHELLRECRERLARKELVIAEFYENRRAWHSVISRVDGLIRVYPTSEYVPDALELKALAHASEGQGEQASEVLNQLTALDAERGARLERRLDRVTVE
jgi:outer membrane protein assembly factor BamD